MALQIQTLSFPLTAGLETQIDRKLVEPPALLDIVDGRWIGPTTLRKRFGYTPVTGPTESTTEIFAYDNGKQLLAQADDKLYGYVPERESWVDRGRLASAKCAIRPLQRSYGNHLFCDAVVYNDGAYVLTAWENVENGTSYVEFKITDRESGMVYQGPTRIEAGRCPKVVADTSLGIAVWYISSANDLIQYRLDFDNPTAAGASYTMTTGVSAGRVFDVVANENTATHAFFAAWEDSAAATIYVGRVTAITFDTISDTTMEGDTAVSIGMGANAISIVSIDADLLTRAVAVNKTSMAISSVSAAVTLLTDTVLNVHAQVTSAADGTYTVFVNCRNTTTGLRSIWYYALTATSTPTASLAAAPTLARYHLNFASKTRETTIADGLTGSVGLLLQSVLTDPTQCTYYYGLLSLTSTVPDLIRCRFNVGSAANGTTAGPLAQCNVMLDDDGVEDRIVIAGLTQAELRLDDTAQVYSVFGTDLYTFTPTDRYSAVELEDTLYFSGGTVMQFDGGGKVVEHGFFQSPFIYSATAGGSGGSLDTSAEYQYFAVYEWTNDRGEIMRSSPSTIKTVTPAAGEEVTLVISTLGLTFKRDTRQPVRIVVYRTEGDSPGPFYRVSGTTVTTGDNRLLLNDLAADTVTLVDALSDASLAGREFPYTEGGVIENDCPPGLSTLTEAKNRLWGADGETIWFTKEYAALTAPEFSGLFTLRVSDRFGDITALAGMDDKLIIFKQRAVYFLSGEGPNVLGVGFFSPVQQIASDTGCVSAASVLSTDRGVYFASEKGIYLLDRALQLHFIGRPVAGYKGQTITSAVLLPDDNEVRFTTAASRALVYNYDSTISRWSTFDNHESLSACMWDGAWTTLGDDGLIRVETDEAFSDDGSFYPLDITTAYYKFYSLEGFQRVYKLFVMGTWKGEQEHTLSMSAAYDYSDDYSESVEISTADAMEVDGYGDGGYGLGEYGGADRDVTYRFRFDLPRTRCASVSFRIRDTSSTPQENYEINALTLEIGVTPKSNHLPEKKVAGEA